MIDPHALEAAELAAQRALSSAACQIAEREGEADARWFSQALGIVAAQAAITAYHKHLAEAGLVIVPAEPTEAMLEAYRIKVADARLKNVLCPEAAYRAMIAAAKGEAGDSA
jgi:hypothetical protein